MSLARTTRAAAHVSLCVAFIAALASPLAAAQARPKVTDSGVTPPSSIVYIGNSFFYYNNGIHSQVGRLAAAADPQHKLSSVMITISGSGFDWHDVDSYFRPEAVGRYTIDSHNVLKFNDRARLFDVAVTMDCSQCPVHPQLKDVFYAQATKFAETVRKHGTQPVYFMSWAYLDKPEMTQALAEAYTRAGNENNALVIPAGLAFARVVKERPDINLYMPDKRHPTVAGTYLAAATIYASLFKKSPVGLSEMAGLEPGTARYLQTVAWETVQNYQAQKL